MNSRLLLVSSDAALIQSVKAALKSVASLLHVEQLAGNNERLQDQFQPSGVIIDTDARIGLHTAFERIADARRQFPSLPVIAMGNEMSAQLILAALRAGAADFIDRDSGSEQIRLAIQSCLAHHAEPARQSRSRLAGVLSGLPSEQDQDFCLNLAVRAARRTPGESVLYIDLSLPATQAGVALNLEMKFSVLDAIREMGRLDKALLESALSREPRSGLYVMPLARDFAAEDNRFEAESFGALLHVLQNIFDIIVIGYGPFSRQRAMLETVGPGGTFFLCCNQRFSSIHGASELMRWLADNRLSYVPELVVHETARALIPAPADICQLLRSPGSINVVGSWDYLTRNFNDGTPPAFSNSAAYCRALDTCLDRMGLIADAKPKPAGLSSLRGWLCLRSEPSAS